MGYYTTELPFKRPQHLTGENFILDKGQQWPFKALSAIKRQEWVEIKNYMFIDNKKDRHEQNERVK